MVGICRYLGVGMRLFCRRVRRSVLRLAPVFFLAGCAGHAIPPATTQTSALGGAYATGTVLALRQVNPQADTPLTQAVLTALGETTPTVAPQQAAELLIRRNDGGIIAFLQPGPPIFAPGESVAIIEAAQTVVRPD